MSATCVLVIIVHRHLGHLSVGRQTGFMNHETTETSETASLSIMYLCVLFCLVIHVMHIYYTLAFH